MRVRTAWWFALAAAAYSAAALGAEPLWSGDFETGDLSQWSPKLDVMAGTTDRLVVVDEPVREGRHALRATVKYGDLVSLGSRAEVVLAEPKFREGDERWFHWYTLFPPEFATSPSWMVFTQWHSNAVSVPLAFSLHGEVLSFRLMGLEYDQAGQWDKGTLWKAPLQRGKWNEYLLHAKFSARSDVGFVELWVDGVPVVPRTMHATLPPGDSVYLKMGLYRDRSISWDQSLYHDGMRMYDADPRTSVVDPTPAGENPNQAKSTIEAPTPLGENRAVAAEPRACGSRLASVLVVPAPLLLRAIGGRFRRRRRWRN